MVRAYYTKSCRENKPVPTQKPLVIMTKFTIAKSLLVVKCMNLNKWHPK